MKKITYSLAIAATLLATSNTFAQQGFGTNTPHRSAAVEIKSTNKGLLIPRVALQSETGTSARLNSSIPNAHSLLVFNETGPLAIGYYYWDANYAVSSTETGKWVAFSTAEGATYTGVNGITVDANNVVKLGGTPITENTILSVEGTSASLNMLNKSGNITIGGQDIPAEGNNPAETFTGDIIIEANTDKLFIKGVQNVPSITTGEGEDVVTSIDLTGYNVLLTDGTGNVWETSAAALVSEGITWTFVKAENVPNTINLTINGVSQPVTIVSDISMSSVVNTMTTTVNGVTSAGVNIINSNTLTNGTSNITVGDDENAVTVTPNNQLISTVNGVATTPFQIIKENSLSLVTTGEGTNQVTNLESTVNGIKTSIPLTSLNSTTTVTDNGLEFNFGGESVETITVTPSTNTTNNTTNYEVSVNPNAIVNQGLFANSGTRIAVASGEDGTTMTNVVKLGGDLLEATTIGTSQANTLAIDGLRNTVPTVVATLGDNQFASVVVDKDGVLRTMEKVKKTTLSNFDTDYKTYFEEVTVEVTLGGNLSLPNPVNANGQIINVIINNNLSQTLFISGTGGILDTLDTDNNDVNDLEDAGYTTTASNILAYGDMLGQRFTLKSDGTNWIVTSRM